MSPEMSRLGVPRPPTAVREAPRILACASRQPPSSPRVVPPPVLRRSLPRAAQSNPSARLARQESCSRAGLGSAGVSLRGRTLLGMLIAPPETRLSRGQDQFSGFSRLPRGR